MNASVRRRATNAPPMSGLSPDAQASVEAEIKRLGTISAVAQRIGYSRPALSLALRGKYGAGSLDHMERKIAAVLGSDVQCPHLGRAITTAACRATRLQPVPTHDPGELEHWQACKSCPRNPASYTLPDQPLSHAPKGTRHAQ